MIVYGSKYTMTSAFKNSIRHMFARAPLALGAVLALFLSCASAQHSDGTYKGMPVGFTDGGHPVIGVADAPVTLMEYSDYQCPFCRRHFDQSLPSLLEQYVATGQLQYVFKDLPFPSLHPTAPAGAEAAGCVAEQGAALFWAMHHRLFETQRDWARIADPREYLAGLASEIGADAAVYTTCMESGRQAKRVSESMAEAKALGFNGTPSFQFVGSDGETYDFIGAQPFASFSAWADALLAGEKPPEPEAPPPPELPVWAKSEGLAPDPARPGYTLAGDAYKGNPEAALVVVEFADLQCPSCRRHALETEPLIDEELVQSGQVMWVFKHFPLRIHANAPAAAAAAECAGDQGQFWEFKHLVFERSDEWTDGDPDTVLMALAEQADLNMNRFRDCYAGRNVMQRVLTDVQDGLAVARSTPTFVLIYEERAHLMRGARDADQFLTILNNIIDRMRTSD